MKTNITYICDYCGKIFDDEDECRSHELEELVKRTDNKIMYFDYDGKRLPIDASPDRIDYFWVADEVAFEYVNNYFDKCGYSRPSVDTYCRKGKFYYDGDEWKNVEELEMQMNAINSIFKEVKDED